MLRDRLLRRVRSADAEPRTVAGHIVLTFHVFPEDGRFVADCTELQISSFGETEEEALRAGLDAVGLYLHTITEIGDVGRVFGERGIKIHPGHFPDDEDFTARNVAIRPMESATVKVLEVPGAVVGVG